MRVGWIWPRVPSKKELQLAEKRQYAEEVFIVKGIRYNDDGTKEIHYEEHTDEEKAEKAKGYLKFQKGYGLTFSMRAFYRHWDRDNGRMVDSRKLTGQDHAVFESRD
jgi:hypothetical protein